MGRVHLRETLKIYHFSVKGEGEIRKRSLTSSVSDNVCIRTVLWSWTSFVIESSIPQSLAWPHACLQILSHITTAPCNVHPMKCCCLYLYICSDLLSYFPLDLLFFRTHINRITVNSSQVIAFSQNGE